MDDTYFSDSAFVDDSPVFYSTIDQIAGALDTSSAGNRDNEDSEENSSSIDDSMQSDLDDSDLITVIENLTLEVQDLHDDLTMYMESDTHLMNGVLIGLFAFMTISIFRKVFDVFR